MTPGQIAPLLENDALREQLIPQMMATATELAHGLSQAEKKKGLQNMNSQLHHEINRLKRLQEQNSNVRNEEIELAKKEKINFESLIENAQVHLDALQLVMVQ